MFFNQEPKAARAAALGCAAVALVACSHFRSHSRSESAATAPAAVASTAAATAPAPTQELTATEAAANAADSGAPPPASTASAPAPTADVLNPNAPKKYTVKRGDTLWGIASMFLRDPWLWPEIWYVNPQVQNPHQIFPGDVLALAYGADGRPQVRLEAGGPARYEQGGGARRAPRLRSEGIDAAIPTIPYAAIASFLSRPTALPSNLVKHSPYVVAFREDHKVGGTGHEAYVRGLGSAAQGARFSVMHVEDKLRDPDGHRTLGYAGVYTATAVVERPGDPAKVLLIDSAQETLSGDILLADDSAVPLTFAPRAAPAGVHGRIVWVANAVQMIGRYDVVALNRGKSDGVDAGTVLAVDQAGDVVPDRGAAAYDSSRKSQIFTRGVRLPDERAGTVLVFKSYDQLSYALVVNASSEIRVADIVRTP
jgi:hypothetical protein